MIQTKTFDGKRSKRSPRLGLIQIDPSRYGVCRGSSNNRAYRTLSQNCSATNEPYIKPVRAAHTLFFSYLTPLLLVPFFTHFSFFLTLRVVVVRYVESLSGQSRSRSVGWGIGGWSWVVLFRSGYFLSAMPFRLAVGSVEETSPLHGEMAEASFLRQIGKECTAPQGTTLRQIETTIDE